MTIVRTETLPGAVPHPPGRQPGRRSGFTSSAQLGSNLGYSAYR